METITTLTGLLLATNVEISAQFEHFVDSPKTIASAQIIRIQLRDIAVVLEEFQSFLAGSGVPQTMVESDVDIEAIEEALTGCVTTFSELRNELNCNLPSEANGIRDNAKSVQFDASLNIIHKRLQWHQRSLALFLRILVSELATPTAATPLPTLDDSESDVRTGGRMRRVGHEIIRSVTRDPITRPDIMRHKYDTEFGKGWVIHRTGEGSEEKWMELKQIGHGGQGTVSLEVSVGLQPQLRAVKKMPQIYIKANKIDIQRELQTMLEVIEYDELFIRLFGWFEDPAEEFLYLAMEYLPHGDLSGYIKQHQQQAKLEAVSITKQLLNGLAILHDKHICHRDLKPQNVLISSLDPIKVKLADFGLSKSTNGTELRTRFGTFEYMAPELHGLLPKHLARGGYTTAVDMWALGCLVHELLTGESPFMDRSSMTYTMSDLSDAGTNETQFDLGLLVDFCKGRIKFPTDSLKAAGVPVNGRRFVKSLLVPNPSKRLSAMRAFGDSWISHGGLVPDTKDRPVPGQVVTHAITGDSGESNNIVLLESIGTVVSVELPSSSEPVRTELENSRGKGSLAKNWRQSLNDIWHKKK